MEKTRNKMGGRAKRALSCVMAAVLALYALPAAAMRPAPAYASDGDAPLDVQAMVSAQIDEDITAAPEPEEPGLLYRLFGVGEAPSALVESGHYLYVNHLYVNAPEVEEGDTMDTVWLEKNGLPVLGQTSTTAPLYETDGDYYVAFTGDAGLSVGQQAMDWSFTEGNLDGIVVDGCIHDPAAGISYVPKSLFRDGDGEEIFFALQNQLMIPYDIAAEEPAGVHVEVANNRGDVTVPAKDRVVDAVAFDSVEVQVATPETAGNVSLSNMTVTVDDAEYGGPGRLVEGENASYDEATGVLKLALPAISTAKVTVTIDDASAIDKILAVEEAHAAAVDRLSLMPYWTFTNLDLNSISVGQRFSYLSYYNSIAAASGDMAAMMNEARDATKGYAYSWTNNTRATAIEDNQTYALADWVLGGNTYSPEQVMNTARDNGALSVALDAAVGYTIDLPGAEGRSTVYDGVDFAVRTNAGAPTWHSVAAYCGHNTQALGNTLGTSMYGGAQAEGTVHMRILAKGDDYVVIGFLSPILNDQSGAVIYKMPVEAKGAIEVYKSSANTSITYGNGCYTLAGAVFEVVNGSGTVVARITTNNDGYGKAEGIPRGTYTVREATAPTGYLAASAQSATVAGGQTTTMRFADQPRNDPERMRVWKSDAESPSHLPEGAASLAGAEFTFRFYAGGYYNENNLPATPTRTWVMKTNEQGYASYLLGENYKVSGNDFYYSSTGHITTPLGTVTAVETKAPDGYFLDNGKSGSENGSPKLFISHIKPGNTQSGAEVIPVNYSEDENVSTLNTPISHDTVFRGNVELVKSDSATLDGKAQAAATLAGAEYDIINANESPVVSPQTGLEVQPGNVVCTIVTDETGFASTTRADLNGWSIPDGTDATKLDAHGDPMDFEGKALAKGAYTVKESKAATGYNLNVTWEGTFTLEEDGQLASLDTTDDVIRGDIEFTKAIGERQSRIAGVPWLLTAKSDGEAHVLVTDENGMVSTESSFNAHSRDTNANDAAVAADGTVDESALDPAAGVWFCGRTDGNGAPVDDSLGALPYDTYTLEELRCSKNEGLDLVSFEVTVSRDSRTLDLGTIDDNPAPYIATTLTDDEETHSVPAGEQTVLTDRVEYAYFDAGTYRFEGELHMVAEDGTDEGVVATATKEHVARSASGYVDMGFVIDTTGCEGKKFVAFEKCVNMAGEQVADHCDLADSYQTIYVPTARTTFTDAADGDHEAPSTGTVTLTDTVHYKGLTPEKRYTVNMTVHKKAEDGTDAGVLLDASGNEVKASANFVPTEVEGDVTVTVTFEPAGGGYEAVAFEEIERKGVTYITHANITDESQSCTLPEVRTTAKDAATGVRALALGGTIKVTDTVAYKGLVPGAEYKLEGTIHVKGATEDGAPADGGALKDADGNEVTATTTFTPESRDGEVEVAFEAEADVAAGTSIVVFEKLYRISNGTLTACHEDAADLGQSLARPVIGTTATVGDTGAHFAGSIAAFKVLDDVKYENLPAEGSYTMRGELHKVAADGSDGGVVTRADGSTVTAELAFEPEEESGHVTLEFDVDPADATGTLVVFEELDVDTDDGAVPVADHKIPSDEGQQVDVAAVGTTARDKESGTHEGTVESSATVVDTVDYRGLEPGAAYKLVGTLMDKSTGEALKDDGEAVMAEKAFKADAKAGSVEMEFVIDNTVLDGTTVVVFEKLYDATGNLVATHEDINSAEQSVAYKAPSLSPLGDALDKTGYWLGQYWWLLAIAGAALAALGWRIYKSDDPVAAEGAEGAADAAEEASDKE